MTYCTRRVLTSTVAGETWRRVFELTEHKSANAHKHVGVVVVRRSGGRGIEKMGAPVQYLLGFSVTVSPGYR